MNNEITFRMQLHYYRNKWHCFTKPRVRKYAERLFSTIPLPPALKIRVMFDRRQRLDVPYRHMSALIGATLLVVIPNTAINVFPAYATAPATQHTQTLTATGTPPALNMDAIYKPQFIYPVGHAEIASPFGWRPAPCDGCSTNHDGVDFHVPQGTEIHAATSGTVTFAGWKSGLGYHIVIDDGYGYVTYYGHMIDGSIPASIGVGSHVSMGDLIGLVGCTGQCTGAHLHFGLQDEGVFVDPMPVLERYAP